MAHLHLHFRKKKRTFHQSKAHVYGLKKKEILDCVLDSIHTSNNLQYHKIYTSEELMMTEFIIHHKTFNYIL